ncbi:4-hydroxybenzoate transporter [Klebsiella pneumoniae IS43]|uniref:4-hydroxybenzoate transporter n=1 Tax=Klebsiella pneumoniae IS43 TaxID=1432552 RepID=W1DXM1_KLEPN|nr:4-hydroxybenzoate transporter [Klebsiella pneumoniae IS43]
MTQTQRLDVRELINRNPLSRFQKLIIFLGFCVIALDGFDIAIMGFIAPTLKLEWGVSNHQLGLVISAALIGLALGAIFSGPLADWLGRKKIIINSVFFFGFWTIATAFSHNVEQMMFFRFMTGLGLGAAMPNIGTLVSEYAPERQRSFIITVIFLRLHLRRGGGRIFGIVADPPVWLALADGARRYSAAAVCPPAHLAAAGIGSFSGDQTSARGAHTRHS